IPLVSLFIFTSGLIWFLATLQVFYYDTRFVLDFVLLVAFYMSPIFYPADFVGTEYKWIVDYNPVTYVLAPFQSLSRAELPPDFAWLCVRGYIAAAVMLGIATFFWNRRRNLAYLHL
ncbi:MAG: ABC transporter permease, partial [Bdellovibrionota bacterium]